MSEIDYYYDIDRMMADHELLLAYRDRITEETVHQLLSITEMKLAQSGEEKKLRKRVFNVLVECLQNVVNHSDKKEDGEQPSILLIGRHSGEFFIITGNKILNSKVEALKERLKEINSWDPSNMREIYSTKLGKSEYSAKGGAGLGLMDIYKRSGRKIKYSIQQINSEVSFLSLHISISNEA
ncbi:SiaB family protein kinase [Bacteroidota bacterium]